MTKIIEKIQNTNVYLLACALTGAICFDALSVLIRENTYGIFIFTFMGFCYGAILFKMLKDMGARV